MSRPPLYVLWPALLLAIAETLFWVALLYVLLRVLLHVIALGASPI